MRMDLDKAIELGEFHPEKLRKFPEFRGLSKHAQLQLVKKAMENCHKQLIVHYADVNNLLDSSRKPEVQKALDRVFKKIQGFEREKEKILLELS